MSLLEAGGHFFGMLETNSGDTTRTSNLEADWTAVEELMQGGQTVQVIEGTLTLNLCGILSYRQSIPNQWNTYTIIW